MDKIEEKSICAECGGYCCKKCGCDYFVGDLESSKIEYFESLLATGRVSVIAVLRFDRLPNGKLTVSPTLYLRARNKNRGEIDLLSLKTSCASLEEHGCYYKLDDRPSGGAVLIPKIEDNCCACYTTVDRIEELKKWSKYQNVLSRIVQRHTGKSVYNKLREDAEALFFDLFSGNVEGVAKEELYDVLNLTKSLKEVYPDELRSAQKRANEKVAIKQKTIFSTKK